MMWETLKLVTETPRAFQVCHANVNLFGIRQHYLLYDCECPTINAA